LKFSCQVWVRAVPGGWRVEGPRSAFHEPCEGPDAYAEVVQAALAVCLELAGEDAVPRRSYCWQARALPDA